VNGKAVLRTARANFAGQAGSLVSVGLGQPSTDRQAGVLLVRSISVAGASGRLSKVAERS
jgi:hypothetical protein